MTAPTPYLDPNGDDTGVEPDRESPPGIPRWVKAFVGLAVVVVLFVVIVMFAGGGGGHGPGRHAAPASSAAPVVLQL